MPKSVGIWIDHEKAFIVTLREGRQEIMRMESNVEGHVRLSGGSRTATNWGPTDVMPEGRPERRRAHHLARFYRDIIDRTKEAGSFYIFGPGEAKDELAKEIRKAKSLAPRIAAVDAADKMTERQIAAKVQTFFSSPSRDAHGRREHR